MTSRPNTVVSPWDHAAGAPVGGGARYWGWRPTDRPVKGDSYDYDAAAVNRKIAAEYERSHNRR
jgi:hypothetical protein